MTKSTSWDADVNRVARAFCGLLLAATAGLALAGCDRSTWAKPAAPSGKVPAPIDLMLPRGIRLHPFTATKVFDPSAGTRGIDVRVEALDAYGDGTKAFGDFRFELYTYRTGPVADPRGRRIGLWDVSLLDPKTNLIHWDSISRTYEFKLQWDEPIAPGQRFVLSAVFSSPFTERFFDQQVFVSAK